MFCCIFSNVISQIILIFPLCEPLFLGYCCFSPSVHITSHAPLNFHTPTTAVLWPVLSLFFCGFCICHLPCGCRFLLLFLLFGTCHRHRPSHTHTHTNTTKLTRIPAHRFTLKLTLTESFVWLVFMTLVWMLNVIRFRRHNGPCNYPLCTPHHSFSPFFYPFPASLLATFYTICS